VGKQFIAATSSKAIKLFLKNKKKEDTKKTKKRRFYLVSVGRKKKWRFVTKVKQLLFSQTSDRQVWVKSRGV